MQTTVNPRGAMSAASPPTRMHLLQRKCACGGTPGPSGECEECRKKRLGDLQRSARARPAPAAAPPIVHQALQSPGQPLDAAARGALEPRFGHDFSRVRVHADAAAAESARAVNADAYTVGSRIVFAAGRYSPQTEAGRKLLVHELTHVIQQRHAGGGRPLPGELRIGAVDTPEEREAERAADLASGRAGSLTASPVRLQRQEAAAPSPAPAPGDAAQAAGESAPVEPGKAPGSEYVFTTEAGVKVVVFRKCGTTEFGFTKIESAARKAFDKIFKSDCISADRRAILQKNLTQFGARIYCKQPNEMELGPTRCAESPQGEGVIKLNKIAFSQNPEASAECGKGDLAIVIFHELMHSHLGAATETFPRSCENSCFDNDRGVPPDLCKNPKAPNTWD